MGKKTGFVWHELYAWHNTGNPAGYVTSSLHVVLWCPLKEIEPDNLEGS